LSAANVSWQSLTDSLAPGGWLMAPILLIAFLIWWSYLSLFVRLRDNLKGLDAHDLDLETRLNREADPTVVCAWLAALPGAVPRMTRQILLRMPRGLAFRSACAQCRFAELDEFGFAMVWLGALVVAAPLLGLLGTVLGMVETFDAVAVRSGEAANLVAGGISQALLTTQTGLLAALPGTFGLAHLFRLYKRLGNRLDRCESHLALVFEHRAPTPADEAPDAESLRSA